MLTEQDRFVVEIKSRIFREWKPTSAEDAEEKRQAEKEFREHYGL